MNRYWILAVTLTLVLGVAGYTLAQPADPPSGMMGQTGNMMGPGMTGQGGMMGPGGHGAKTGGGLMNMMSGQPLTQEQLEQFARQHGITVERAKQMTDSCEQAMQAPGTDQKAQ